MLNIAKRYHDGRGTNANDILAATWAMNARGFGDAPELYNAITANFTPKQINDVKKKSAQLGGPGALLYQSAK